VIVKDVETMPYMLNSGAGAYGRQLPSTVSGGALFIEQSASA
jgi:hypothetical protein